MRQHRAKAHLRCPRLGEPRRTDCREESVVVSVLFVVVVVRYHLLFWGRCISRSSLIFFLFVPALALWGVRSLL